MQGIFIALECALVGLALWLARQNGKHAARIKALEKELNEYAKSQQVMGRVHRMSVDTVRQRLHHIQGQ